MEEKRSSKAALPVSKTHCTASKMSVIFEVQTSYLPQQWHNSKSVIFHFSWETFRGFEVLKFSMSATTTQPLSSGEFCKLGCDTIPVKSASANVSFYTNNSKMLNFELWHSSRKWAKYTNLWLRTFIKIWHFLGWPIWRLVKGLLGSQEALWHVEYSSLFRESNEPVRTLPTELVYWISNQN
jgi:hypothetical protein